MKIKHITATITFLLLILTGHTNAQSSIIDIVRWDNSEKKVDLELLKKLTFTANDLVLNYQTGTVENIVKADIRKVVFGTSTGVKPINSQSSLLIYPNPAGEFITIKNIPDSHYLVNVYSITGSQVLSVQINSLSQQIIVSELPKGLYFLKVNNQVAKFTKQ